MKAYVNLWSGEDPGAGRRRVVTVLGLRPGNSLYKTKEAAEAAAKVVLAQNSNNSSYMGCASINLVITPEN